MLMLFQHTHSQPHSYPEQQKGKTMNRMMRYLSFSSLLILLLLSACRSPLQPEAVISTVREELAEVGAEEHTEEHTEGQDPHWTYAGEEGPAHWGLLSDKYALCASGHAQSPINLTSADGENLPDITFSYQPAALKIGNNGHTVQVDYAPGSFIEVDGTRYELKQFHFHSASEHNIDGVAYPLEMHLVHSAADGKYAVVGVMLEVGAENPAFAAVVENAPAETRAAMEIGGSSINALEMLPTEGTYFGYTGSLTTPPCTEGVKWHVMTTPVQVSQAQIDTLSSILHSNFRPLQELNERELAVDTESATTK